MLVLRAVELALAGVDGREFVVRRAEEEVPHLEATAERRILGKLLDAVTEPGASAGRGFAMLLAAYAAALERSRRFPEAEDALGLALRLEPTSPDVLLRAARIARIRGRQEQAARLYGRVRELDDGTGRWARLASVGEALLSAEPVRSLSRAMRAAVRAGDAEAAAIALEERAARRRAAGDVAGAVRDMCVAALRHDGASNRARAAHGLADLLGRLGDRPGMREALLAAASIGEAPQRAYAASRLHDLARAEGDELGMRRWARTRGSGFVAFTPAHRACADGSAVRHLRRWRARLEEARGAERNTSAAAGLHPVVNRTRGDPWSR